MPLALFDQIRSKFIKSGAKKRPSIDVLIIVKDAMLTLIRLFAKNKALKTFISRELPTGVNNVQHVSLILHMVTTVEKEP
jgi:hypothetical protein